MSSRRWLAALLAVCCLLFARRGVAQQPSSKAEVLFQTGLKDMRDGRYDAACPKLAASYALEALPGVLFTLAECEAGWGKPARAIDHYQSFIQLLSAMDPARRASFEERRGIAVEMIDALNAVAPEIAIDVSPDVPQEVVVKRNGALVAPSAYGVSKKVDPGEYELTAELAGRAVWQRRVRLAPRERVRVQLPASSQWGRAPAPSSAVPAQEPRPRALSRDRRVRTATVVAGSLGAAGLGIGIATGALAWSKKSMIDEHCPDDLCDRDGRRALDWAKRAALASTLGFAVGLAGAATATTLAVWSRRNARASATSRLHVWPALGSKRSCAITVEGRF